MRIRKGDTVKVISGKDKGKSGRVVNVSEGRATVESVNLYKKHVRPKKAGKKGETIIVPRPINASNLMIVCPNCQKASRVACRIEGGKKARICKKCQALI